MDRFSSHFTILEKKFQMLLQEIKIYNLPNDFSTADELSQPVMIRAYQSPIPSLRNKSIINWNMIDIILMGKKTIIDISGMPSLETGELMVLSKGSCLISQAIPGNGLFKSIVIYFTNEFLADFLIKYRELFNPVKSLDKKPFLKYEQDLYIASYIKNLSGLLQKPETCIPAFKLIKAEEILLYLAIKEPGKLQSLAVIAKDNGDMELRKAVENMLGTKVTIEELAFLCNNSISSFKRRFFNIYGMPPQKWITQNKIVLAAALLRRPDECVTTVYQKAGYESHSSFTKAFKLYHGITPKAYQAANSDFQDKNLDAW
jgi:AraC-like DNA-binding protein